MIVLDGGTGRELERRGVAVPSGIWAAQALMDAPEAVVEVHRDFIAAGADVVITNNYAVVPRMLATAGAEGRFEELTALSGALAQEAREGCDRDVRIAGSLPPLASSYRHDMVGSSDETMPVYAKIVATLAPLVDLFVCETMTTAEEARTAVTAATESGRPVWVSWTLSDEATGRLRSGETVAEAVAALEDLPVEAYLFNCCSPESISVALPELRANTDRAIGGYANAFPPIPAGYDQASSPLNPLRGDLDPLEYLAFVHAWLAEDATIIGGCCGIGPAHIARIRELIAARDPD